MMQPSCLVNLANVIHLTEGVLVSSGRVTWYVTSFISIILLRSQLT